MVWALILELDKTTLPIITLSGGNWRLFRLCVEGDSLALFCFLFFQTGFLCVTLAVLELISVDQASLKLRNLPTSARQGGWLVFKDFFLFYMYVWVLQLTYVHQRHVWGLLKPNKGVGSPRTCYQLVISCQGSARNWTQRDMLVQSWLTCCGSSQPLSNWI